MDVAHSKLDTNLSFTILKTIYLLLHPINQIETYKFLRKTNKINVKPLIRSKIPESLRCSHIFFLLFSPAVLKANILGIFRNNFVSDRMIKQSPMNILHATLQFLCYLHKRKRNSLIFYYNKRKIQLHKKILQRS